jgi:hypothetical protein
VDYTATPRLRNPDWEQRDMNGKGDAIAQVD